MFGAFGIDDYIEVVLTIDGVRHGADLNDSLLHAVDEGGIVLTGWLDRSVEAPLAAGEHTITVGLYSNTSIPLGNSVRGTFDNVQVHASVDAGDLEFIELFNPTAGDVDLTGWRIRKGVDFDFDPGTILPAGGRLAVLGFNPDKAGNEDRAAAFRSAYGIDESVQLVGGYGGALANEGDRIQLQRPDSPPLEDPQFIPYLLEDELIYDDVAPWPTGAAGEGLSLQRIDADAWGPDPVSWMAAAANPGAVGDTVLPADFDLNGEVGISDFVILKNNFGRQGDATWATGDADGDGNVGIPDFVILKNNFGRTAAAAAPDHAPDDLRSDGAAPAPAATWQAPTPVRAAPLARAARPIRPLAANPRGDAPVRLSRPAEPASYGRLHHRWSRRVAAKAAPEAFADVFDLIAATIPIL